MLDLRSENEADRIVMQKLFNFTTRDDVIPEASSPDGSVRDHGRSRLFRRELPDKSCYRVPVKGLESNLTFRSFSFSLLLLSPCRADTGRRDCVQQLAEAIHFPLCIVDSVSTFHLQSERCHRAAR